jgi:hypothetical protein
MRDRDGSIGERKRMRDRDKIGSAEERKINARIQR